MDVSKDYHKHHHHCSSTLGLCGQINIIPWTMLSKWFYDTSIGVATGAARCGSFIGGSFDLLVARYGWTRWTQRFIWFIPSERNTLCSRKNWVVLLKPTLPVWAWALSFFPAYLSTDPCEGVPVQAFIAQDRAVTMSPEARQVVSGQVEPYVVGHNG
jgi:hypothetical protein